jgi:hypothetical protein
MITICLSLNTDVETFIAWIERYTNSMISSSDGYITTDLGKLQIRPLYRRTKTTLTIDGSIMVSDRFSMTKDELIGFKLIETPIGLDVQIRRDRVVSKYFEQMLKLINAQWPETEKVLREYSNEVLTEAIDGLIRLTESKMNKKTSVVNGIRPEEKPNEPIRPPEPKKGGGNISEWLGWYHDMHIAGYKTTLRDVAEKSGWSYGYVRQSNQRYKSSVDLTTKNNISNKN